MHPRQAHLAVRAAEVTALVKTAEDAYDFGPPPSDPLAGAKEAAELREAYEALLHNTQSLLSYYDSKKLNDTHVANVEAALRDVASTLKNGLHQVQLAAAKANAYYQESSRAERGRPAAEAASKEAKKLGETAIDLTEKAAKPQHGGLQMWSEAAMGEAARAHSEASVAYHEAARAYDVANLESTGDHMRHMSQTHAKASGALSRGDVKGALAVMKQRYEPTADELTLQARTGSAPRRVSRNRHTH